MKRPEAREVISEIERVQIIRKRAETQFFYCRNCRTHADFVSLAKTTRLFNIRTDLIS